MKGGLVGVAVEKCIESLPDERECGYDERGLNIGVSKVPNGWVRGEVWLRKVGEYCLEPKAREFPNELGIRAVYYHVFCRVGSLASWAFWAGFGVVPALCFCDGAPEIFSLMRSDWEGPQFFKEFATLLRSSGSPSFLAL